MPLSNLLKSAADTCRYCGKKTGILTRAHPDCESAHQAGLQQMVELAAQAVRSHNFDEKSLRLSLAETAKRSFGDGTTVNQALKEGWKQGVDHAMTDGIMTQAEESSLREFRDRLPLDSTGADPESTAQLEKAWKHRPMLDARLAALAVDDPDTHLDDLVQSLRNYGLREGQQTALWCGPGRPPSKAPWRTGFSSWTKRTPRTW